MIGKSSSNSGIGFSYDGKILIKSDEYEDGKLTVCENFNGFNFDINVLKDKIKAPVDFVELGHWKSCFLKCLYCNEDKVDDLSLVNHFDIFPVIEELFDKKYITKDTKIIFECGDATLHPEFDKLMYYFINTEMKDITIKTSAQRYCHSIAEAIDKKIVKVIVSFDCGCPYIYERVKGYNKFDIAVSVIKKYIQYDDRKKKRVILNYTIINGVNDNQKEIFDWFMFSRGLGIKKLSLDIENKWFEQLNGNIPDYLKELLMFTKDLSGLNNYDIEFTPKLDDIYNKIKSR